MRSAWGRSIIASSRIASLAVASWLALIVVMAAPAPASAACATGSTTFNYTGGEQCYTVPSGVHQIAVTAIGAGGGEVCSWPAGKGAQISADVPVTPGETLYAEVGGVGGSSCLGGGAAGGFNGGASGGKALAGSGAVGGAGGGGASDLRTVSASGGYQLSLGSRVIVAGAGGGDGGNATSLWGYGGNAETAGESSTGGASGGTAGGAGAPGTGGGATNCGGHPGYPGSDGTFGAGGAGGGDTNSFDGGGGGGGGYFGGGGGAADDSAQDCYGGGGGGGGSSWITPSATNPSGPAPTSSAAEVAIVPLTPSASAGPSPLTFASIQPQDTVSSPQTVNVRNAAGANAPLDVTDVTVTGADPGDFLIGRGCESEVAPGASCAIQVYFIPQATGTRTATLAISTNDPAHATLNVTLTGTGGSLPTGPPGAQGPPGATGQQGPAGQPGTVELVTCKTVTVKKHRHGKTVRVKERKCTTKTLASGVRFTASATLATAKLTRGRITFATGMAGPRGEILVLRRTLRPGRYTLTVTRHRGHHRVVIRTSVTID